MGRKKNVHRPNPIFYKRQRERDYQRLMSSSLSWVNDVKHREAEINLEASLFLPLPSPTPFTSHPLIYISIYSFISAEVWKEAVVDIWNSKMLINIQMCWFYMVRQCSCVNTVCVCVFRAYVCVRRNNYMRAESFFLLHPQSVPADFNDELLLTGQRWNQLLLCFNKRGNSPFFFYSGQEPLKN